MEGVTFSIDMGSNMYVGFPGSPIVCQGLDVVGQAFLYARNMLVHLS